jgi:hypothetical protein
LLVRPRCEGRLEDRGGFCSKLHVAVVFAMDLVA